MTKNIVQNTYLRDFLIKHQVFGKFIYNLINAKDPVLSKIGTRMRMINTEESEQVINSAFIWKTTPEGHEFWEELNEKYKSNLYKYKYD